MASVALSFVVRFSSEDVVFKAENLCNGKADNNARAWKIAKEDLITGRMEGEFQLEKASYISHIDIGNCGSAFIEILVGNSMWSQNKPYVTLLPSAMLMSPTECKHWTKTHTVRMFNQSAFSKKAVGSQWDRVRVICLQPFRKDKQFGLSFMRLGSVPDESKACSSDRLTPAKVVVPTSRESMDNQTHDDGVTRLKKASGLMGCLRDIEKGSSDVPLNRAERILHAALDSRSPGTPRNRNKRKLSQSSPEISRNPESPLLHESNLSLDQEPSDKRKKEKRKWSLSGNIEDEVALFLEEIDFANMDLHSITFKDLRNQMEEQRGCSLTRLEKKVFLQLAKAAIEKSVPTESDTEDVSDDCISTADITTVVEKSDNIQADESKLDTRRSVGKHACLSQRESIQTRTPSLSRPSTLTASPTETKKQKTENNNVVIPVSDERDENLPSCLSTVIVHADHGEDELPSMLYHSKDNKPAQYDLFGYPKEGPESSMKNKSLSCLVECPLCNRFFLAAEVEFHAAFCTGESQPPVTTPTTPEKEVALMQCPICSKLFPISDIEEHADRCVQTTIMHTEMKRGPLTI
ncbi:Protein XNDC1N [Acropora cervicornis]|uniref:Protein XNDC1N n=1 Tax=Acropora cervicornis TaxID=6130 RepID=A0AAD9VH68_ACRCE|nr:Protein XNDC1N [Acropora cervicornis]